MQEFIVTKSKVAPESNPLEEDDFGIVEHIQRHPEQLCPVRIPSGTVSLHFEDNDHRTRHQSSEIPFSYHCRLPGLSTFGVVHG